MHKTIMVVDDEPDVVLMLESRLQASGYDVITASDGTDALEKIQKQIPDLIVLDLIMPNMDGATLAQVLKEDPKTENIPIIFLTALRTEKEGGRGPKVGKNLVVAKPFRAEVLLEVIEEIL